MWIKGILSQKRQNYSGEILGDFLNIIPIKKKKNQYFKEEEVKVDICRVT